MPKCKIQPLHSPLAYVNLLSEFPAFLSEVLIELSEKIKVLAEKYTGRRLEQDDSCRQRGVWLTYRSRLV
jgi:hypothetical protein